MVSGEQEEEQRPLLQESSSYNIEETIDSIQDSVEETIQDIQETAVHAAKKISTFWTDFTSFMNSKNLFEVAIGIIIGNGISSLLISLVDDIFLPPLSFLSLKNQRMKDSFVVLSVGASGNGSYITLTDAKLDGAITLNLGFFIVRLLEFLANAFVLFWIIKGYQKIKKSLFDDSALPTMKACAWCFEDIRVKALKCKHCSTLCSLLPVQDAKFIGVVEPSSDTDTGGGIKEKEI